LLEIMFYFILESMMMLSSELRIVVVLDFQLHSKHLTQIINQFLIFQGWNFMILQMTYIMLLIHGELENGREEIGVQVMGQYLIQEERVGIEGYLFFGE